MISQPAVTRAILSAIPLGLLRQQSCPRAQRLPPIPQARGHDCPRYAFRVGHSDAHELSREFGQPFATETFTSLDRFRIIARLSEDGQTRVPFQGATLPPIDLQIARRPYFRLRAGAHLIAISAMEILPMAKMTAAKNEIE